MGKNAHGTIDEVRHAIKSHNLMLVSLPREVSLRAGIRRGVDVRVGQAIDNPTLITLEVLNPADLGSELKDYLGKRKRLEDNRAAKEKRSADREKAKAKKAKAKEKADAKKAVKKKAAEMKAVAEKAAKEPVEEEAGKEAITEIPA